MSSILEARAAVRRAITATINSISMVDREATREEIALLERVVELQTDRLNARRVRQQEDAHV